MIRIVARLGVVSVLAASLSVVALSAPASAHPCASQLVGVNPSGSTDGGIVAVSGNGSATGGFVTVAHNGTSETCHSHNSLECLINAGVAVSTNGNAIAHCWGVALSVLGGDAFAGLVAVALLGSAGAPVAIGWDNASGTAAVAVFGDAQGVVAASVFGCATGLVSVDLC